MTKEERDLLEPMIRDLLRKSNGSATDEEVAEALEMLGRMADEAGESNYHYEHPDYGKMVKPLPDFLRPLIDDMAGDEEEVSLGLDELTTACSALDRGVLAEALSSIVYYWLDKFHLPPVLDPNDDSADVWPHAVHLAIVLAERFSLRECIPMLLELERQDRAFAVEFFDNYDMAGMPGACIYRVAMEEDLPMLGDFVRERGIHTFAKAEVIAAVATLPRRNPETLPVVQKWLCDVLAIFDDEIDPEVGDVMLLEAIVHCCIHARCETAKPLIIRMYSKYKMPNIMIPGGVNEVRKTIKKAKIGVLAEDRNSAETIFWNGDINGEGGYDFDEDDDYGEDNVDFDDYEEYEEDFDDAEFDESELEPRQKYCGWAYGGKARHLPVTSQKKYTLRIELKNSEPLIWRELEVPSSLSLSSLAQAILLAMGWDEDHLHQFVHKRKDTYSTSQNEPFDSPFHEGKDGSRYGISHLLQKKGDSTVFEYDYGDSWYHDVKLKSVDEYASGEKNIVKLIGGANACPPDDCGGIHRYRYLLKLMKEQPKSRELFEFYDWMGCKWDPEYFPMKEAATAVNRLNG